jgi:hypothetical protein
VRDATAHATKVVGPATLLCSVVLLATAAGIFFLWSGPDRAWVHPELIAIGQHIWSPSASPLSTLATLFQWQLFDPNPHRLRIVSDLFEIIDASLRPYAAQVFFHPVVGLTLVLFSVLVPILVFKTLRVYTVAVPYALLLCALLLTTPGFLSNIFVYLRPAKPLSFIVLGFTIYLFSEYIVRGNRERLWLLAVSILIGFFTDELLFWTPLFIGMCVGLIRPALLDRRCIAALSLPFVAYFLLAILILPAIYKWLGPSGARRLLLTNPSTGDQPLVRMLTYPLSTDFLISSALVCARSFAANLGVYSLSVPVISASAGALLSYATALGLFYRRRRSLIWQLGTVGLLGFVSFSVFATWLDWYNGPHSNEDLGALTYYYHSPISFFFVLMMGAGFLILAHAQRPTTIAHSVGLIVVVLAISTVAAINVRSFLQINDVVRIVHLGPTQSEQFFRAGARASSSATVESITTGDPQRMTRTAAQLDEAGYEALGPHWTTSILYRRREDFDNMPWYGPSYARFGRLYLAGLCTIFFGANPCPIKIEEF